MLSAAKRSRNICSFLSKASSRIKCRLPRGRLHTANTTEILGYDKSSSQEGQIGHELRILLKAFARAVTHPRSRSKTSSVRSSPDSSYSYETSNRVLFISSTRL